jgi:hypothetical protein
MSEITPDMAWCQRQFAILNENGVWGVPRSGLTFQKQGDKLVLIDLMPHMPGMPLTAAQLREHQRQDYELIRGEFAAAGITITAAVEIGGETNGTVGTLPEDAPDAGAASGTRRLAGLRDAGAA